MHDHIALSRRRGLSYIPAVLPSDSGHTFVASAGRLWDLTTWMPGQADFHAQPSPERLAAACIALAQIHEAWRPVATTTGPCPALRRRLIRGREWSTLVGSGWQPPLEGADPVGPLTRQAYALLREQLGDVLDRLGAWEHQPWNLQVCLCDVWHDHVLFVANEVTGIIDFGSLKVDHVAVDLARLLGQPGRG